MKTLGEFYIPFTIKEGDEEKEIKVELTIVKDGDKIKVFTEVFEINDDWE